MAVKQFTIKRCTSVLENISILSESSTVIAVQWIGHSGGDMAMSTAPENNPEAPGSERSPLAALMGNGQVPPGQGEQEPERLTEEQQNHPETHETQDREPSGTPEFGAEESVLLNAVEPALAVPTHQEGNDVFWRLSAVSAMRDVAPDPQSADLLGRITRLIPSIRPDDSSSSARSLDLAVTALAAGNTQAASAIVKELARRARWQKLMLSGLTTKTGSPILRLFVGLMANIILLPVVMAAGSYMLAGNYVAGIQMTELFVVGIAGALGSVVSILVRIQDFQAPKGEIHPAADFLTGFCKPLMGAAFAMFIYAAIEGNLLPVEDGNIYLLVTLGFMAGFSERYARDVATRAEDKHRLPETRATV